MNTRLFRILTILARVVFALLFLSAAFIGSYSFGITRAAGALFDRLGGSTLIVFSSVVFIALVAFNWLGALLHELGHAWGGVLVGHEFVQIRVWRFALIKNPDGFKFRFEKTARPYGATVSLPTSGDHLRQRKFLAVLLGPLTSLLLFVVLGVISIWLSLRANMADGAAVAWIALLGLFSLIALGQGVLNLIPAKTERYANDGYQLLGIIRRDPFTEAGLNIALLFGRLRRGERPRDFDEEIMTKALRLAADPTQETLANWLAFYWALDRGDPGSAANFLDRSMALDEQKMVAAFPDLLLDAAFLAARYRSDPILARSLVAKTAGRSIQAAMSARADAAILLAEGDFRGALDRAAEGVKLLNSHPTGGKIAEIEWLEEIARLARGHAGSEAVSP